MTEVVGFRVSHAVHLQGRTVEASEAEKLLTQKHFEIVEKLGRSYTIMIDGKIYACCGTVEYWPGRCEAWALIDQSAPDRFLPIVRAFERILDGIPEKRIEATVKSDFQSGHRLLRLLGFRIEVEQMKNYGVCGSAHSLYSRVK